MTLTIWLLDRPHLADVDRIDPSFTVETVLALRIENGRLAYTTVPVEPYSKRYPPDPVDWTCYIDHPEKAAFLAYLDEATAGQIRLSKNWNGFGLVEDLAVDVGYRRQGVGRALMERAIIWAAETGLPGLMLETQNNNVAACRLYESCGFELGGFDRHLYHGLDPSTSEIALYWYQLFDLAPSSEYP